MVARVAETGELDLAGLEHDRSTHADLLRLSLLAWWLASTELDVAGWTIRTPAPGTAPFRQIARAGLLTAAHARDLTVLKPDGGQLVVRDFFGTGPGQARLPGVDWGNADALTSDEHGAKLRIIPDLADPRRESRRPEGWRALTFPWLADLHLESAAITPLDYQRFVLDADFVLAELVDNVHRWSNAQHAFTAISTTRGSSRDGRSWNRVHIVVADAGIGIPAALRRDLRALDAVRRLGDDLVALDDGEIVERLMRQAFGGREITNHNGHGLNVAQVRSGQWIGALDVVTTSRSGGCQWRGSRGVGQGQYLQSDDIALPGVRGTLVHVLLQAVSDDARAVAAELEQIPIDETAFVAA